MKNKIIIRIMNEIRGFSKECPLAELCILGHRDTGKPCIFVYTMFEPLVVGESVKSDIEIFL
jgi:hypothetical protein